MRDPKYETEVYPLPNSNPYGKVVIRKGQAVVIVWPGDLAKMIDELIALEWRWMMETGKVELDTQHTAEYHP